MSGAGSGSVTPLFCLPGDLRGQEAQRVDREPDGPVDRPLAMSDVCLPAKQHQAPAAVFPLLTLLRGPLQRGGELAGVQRVDTAVRFRGRDELRRMTD